MNANDVAQSALQNAGGSFAKLIPALLGILALLAVAAILLRLLNRGGSKPLLMSSGEAEIDELEADVVISYRKQSFILSKAENTFRSALKKALPNNTDLLTQIPLSLLLAVDPKSNNKRGDGNRINKKSVDFVICDQWTRPLLVIELDDSTHSSEKRKTRDQFLDTALASAGIRILHIAAANSYDINELQNQITQFASA